VPPPPVLLAKGVAETVAVEPEVAAREAAKAAAEMEAAETGAAATDAAPPPVFFAWSAAMARVCSREEWST